MWLQQRNYRNGHNEGSQYSGTQVKSNWQILRIRYQIDGRDGNSGYPMIIVLEFQSQTARVLLRSANPNKMRQWFIILAKWKCGRQTQSKCKEDSAPRFDRHISGARSCLLREKIWFTGLAKITAIQCRTRGWMGRVVVGIKQTANQTAGNELLWGYDTDVDYEFVRRPGFTVGEYYF